MTLRTNNLKASQLSDSFAQFDIRTTARHIRRNRNCSHLTRIRDNLRLKLMELGIQHLMRNILLLQHSAQLF